MAEYLIWFALGCALVSGLFMGRHSSAWPLLASGLAGQAFDSARLFDDWRFALCVDLIVFVLILRRNMVLAEKLILALFLVAWAAYALADPARYIVTASVVIAQLLLTIPINRFQAIGGAVSHGSLREVMKYEGT